MPLLVGEKGRHNLLCYNKRTNQNHNQMMGRQVKKVRGINDEGIQTYFGPW